MYITQAQEVLLQTIANVGSLWAVILLVFIVIRAYLVNRAVDVD